MNIERCRANCIFIGTNKVVMLPGFENSNGARAEMYVAGLVGIPIVLADDLLLD